MKRDFGREKWEGRIVRPCGAKINTYDDGCRWWRPRAYRRQRKTSWPRLTSGALSIRGVVCDSIRKAWVFIDKLSAEC